MQATEARLRAAEIELERLRLTTDAAGVGTWDFDPTSGRLIWDTACKAAFGLPADAAIDYGVFLRHLHPDDRETTDRAVQAALDPAGPGRYDIEYRTCGPDRVVRHVRATGRAIMSRGPGVPHAARFVGTVQDVSEARRAEAGQRETEQRFRQMANQAPVMLWELDVHGDCTFVNARWSAFTGQTEETALGRGWLDAVHPDDLARTAAVFEEAVARQAPFTLDYRLRGPDGVYRWALDVGAPRHDASGTLIGYVGSVVDISERHAVAEERERLLTAERMARARTGRLQLLTAALADAESAEETARVLLDVGLPAAGAIAGAVAARDEDALIVLRAEGYPPDLVQPFMRLPLAAPLPSTHAARTGEALFLLGEAEWNARFDARAAIVSDELGEGAWAALPLRASERLLGVWALSYAVRGPFDAPEREFLLALAGQAAQALERARLRDEEREARERLALAQTAARIGTFDWDVPSGRVTWTAETERLFGLEPGTFAGTYQAWRPLMHPADAEQAERMLSEAAARGDREVDLAFRVRRRPDGAVRWIEGRALLTYAPDGTLVRVVGTNVDVTQRRTAERRAAWLQELATLLSGAVATDDVARVVLEHGRAATGAAGAVVMLRSIDAPDELEQVAGAGMPDHLLEAWVRVALDADVPTTHVVRTGAAVWAETRDALSAQFPDPLVADYARDAGYEAWVALPLTVDDRVLGAVIFGFSEARTFEDDERRFLLALARQCGLALERARLFEAERHARAAAEAANRAKGEFLAIMSHELRTPLNAIGGYAELLEMGLRGPVNDAQRSDLTRIQQSQRHLLGLINEVLNYARVEGGAVHYALRDVPVAPLVASVEPLVRPQLEAKGLTLHTTAGAPGLAMRADEDKLRQILLNLLSNAVKFTERGGHVTLDAEADRDAGRERLRVADTGIGIPHDKQDLIFDPFVQVNASLTRLQEGVGLGLAISRDLARGMGGELTVESTPGQGSTFTLSMPPAGGAG